jgi:hypothetical protein
MKSLQIEYIQCNQGVCVIMHLENVKSTNEGIIPTGSVADFLESSSFAIFS